MSTAALARPRSLTEADVEMVRISDIEVGIRLAEKRPFSRVVNDLVRKQIRKEAA